MYVDNTSSYLPSTLTKQAILQKWESFYGRENGWDRFFPYPAPKRIDLPSAYTLFKNKSLEKYRPITSYAAHPYKRLFNAAARGLNFILENCVAKHFNLAKICNLKSVVEGINEKLSSSNFDYNCLTGDLANMYTSLDHSSIRAAIHWVLFETSKTRFRDRGMVSIPVSKADNDVHFGRSVDSDGSRITLSYKEIVKIVDFDLSNSFFKIGSFLGKQTMGIPMGSPLSPALAVIVCAFYENRLYKMIENFGWNNTIVGTRYMDDILSFVTHDGSPLSRLRADCILNFLRFGYHKNMDLECEDTSIPFKFLSTVVSAVPGSPVSISFHSKNASSIRSRGVQDFLTFQHYGSVSPPSQKLSVVISALHRICMSSMNLDDFWISTSDLVSELGTLEYPSSVISTAISRVSSHPRFASLSPPS